MGPSGGGYSARASRPSETFIEPARERTRASDYETAVAERLNELLAAYNQRDTEATNERLDEIREIFADYLESSVTLRFGGSVSKHTYVDGLSDVDCLLFLQPSKFSVESPQELLHELETALQEMLGTKVEVTHGPLAVTLTYNDGSQIQILPALRTSTGVRIPTSEESGWSHVIRPETFARTLSEVNQRLQGKVVPVIKLAKAAIANLGLPTKLEGYHIEALAVRIFQDYQGPSHSKAMVQHFFERAGDLVRTPIKDLTGQSVYVDEYLGPRNSSQRESIGQALREVSGRMREADQQYSEEEWLRSIDAL